MDFNEIFNYVSEGIKWVSLGGIVYSGAIIGCYIYDGTLFHKKIESSEELEKIVKEEAINLGLDSTKIDVRYNYENKCFARKNEERYYLHLANSWEATRNTVRHELYHILKDCHRKNTFFYEKFIAEPRAILYGTFGIKI